MNIFKVLIKNLIFKTNANLFCFLINNILFIKKKTYRYSYNNKTKMYEIKEGLLNKTFYEKERHIDLYKNGLINRGLTLSKEYLLTQIKFSDGDFVVDCGANVGDLKIFFESNNININYLGIEPSSREFECLRLNVGFNNCINIGLFNMVGNLNFYVSSATADSSLIKPPIYEYIETVLVKRLDDLNLSNIKLLKIEAEGAEPEIIIGGLNTIKNVEYISVDVGPERGLQKNNTFTQVLNILYDNNFKLIDVGYPRLTALFQNTNNEY